MPAVDVIPLAARCESDGKIQVVTIGYYSTPDSARVAKAIYKKFRPDAYVYRLFLSFQQLENVDQGLYNGSIKLDQHPLESHIYHYLVVVNGVNFVGRCFNLPMSSISIEDLKARLDAAVSVYLDIDYSVRAVPSFGEVEFCTMEDIISCLYQTNRKV